MDTYRIPRKKRRIAEDEAPLSTSENEEDARENVGVFMGHWSTYSMRSLYAVSYNSGNELEEGEIIEETRTAESPIGFLFPLF